MRKPALLGKIEHILEHRHQRLSYYPLASAFAWSFVVLAASFSIGLLMALTRIV